MRSVIRIFVSLSTECRFKIPHDDDFLNGVDGVCFSAFDPNVYLSIHPSIISRLGCFPDILIRLGNKKNEIARIISTIIRIRIAHPPLAALFFSLSLER